MTIKRCVASCGSGKKTKKYCDGEVATGLLMGPTRLTSVSNDRAMVTDPEFAKELEAEITASLCSRGQRREYINAKGS